MHVLLFLLLLHAAFTADSVLFTAATACCHHCSFLLYKLDQLLQFWAAYLQTGHAQILNDLLQGPVP